MSNQLWREATDAERKNHPDVEMLAVMPLERDYEAALKLHRDSWHPLISGAQCDDELGAVKLLVDAALEGADDE